MAKKNWTKATYFVIKIFLLFQQNAFSSLIFCSQIKKWQAFEYLKHCFTTNVASVEIWCHPIIIWNFETSTSHVSCSVYRNAYTTWTQIWGQEMHVLSCQLQMTRKHMDFSTPYVSVCESIRVLDGCDRKIHPEGPLWHHEACRLMPNRDAEGRIFLSNIPIFYRLSVNPYPARKKKLIQAWKRGYLYSRSHYSLNFASIYMEFSHTICRS